MRRALILLFTLIATHAMAFDATKAIRYPSPDMYRPNVDQLTINGAGGVLCANPTGCDVSTMGVKPTGGNIFQSLQQIIDNTRSAESFGAKGDGTTDDTAAFQAISAWMGAAPGRGVVGRTGAVYMVTNWVWPFQNNNSFTCPATCTVQALSGGDSDYLVATSRYVSNVAFLDYPVFTRNVVFDAAGIKAKAFVVQTYFSKFEKTMANNATQDGWSLTALTRNGTAVSVGVENKWFESGAVGNGRHGMNSSQYTDSQIIGGDWHDNGGANGMAGCDLNINQMAGWTIIYVHTYNTKSLAAGCGMNLAGVGYGSTISNNYLENIVTIASVDPATNSAAFGPGNTLFGGLNAQIGNNSPVTLTSFGNFYKSDTGQIRHQYIGADHVVRSVSETFDTAAPFVWNAATSPGVIHVEQGFSKALSAPINGDYIGGSIVAPSEVKLRKTLSANTTTTVTVTAVVSKDANLSPFEVVLDVYGTEWSNNYSTVDAFSAQVLAVGARQYQSATSASKATIARSNSTNAGITFAVTSATAGGTDDQTMTFTLTITHPVSSSVSDSPIEARAALRSRAVKSLTIQ